MIFQNYEREDIGVIGNYRIAYCDINQFAIKIIDVEKELILFAIKIIKVSILMKTQPLPFQHSLQSQKKKELIRN